VGVSVCVGVREPAQMIIISRSHGLAFRQVKDNCIALIKASFRSLHRVSAQKGEHLIFRFSVFAKTQ
jgi:hypothetical protein